MKIKRILRYTLLCSILLIGNKAYGLTVYDPANHQANLQQYQVAIQQEIQMYKTLVENILHTQNQLQQLQNDSINLASIGAGIIGEENQALVQTVLDLKSIYDNTDSIIRNTESFENNYKDLFLDFDDYKKLNHEDLDREATRVVRQINHNLLTSIRLANKSNENMERERTRLNTFTAGTSNLSGNLQTQQAIKSVNEDMSNKLSRLEMLMAEEVRMKALEKQQEITFEEINKERLYKTLTNDVPKKVVF